MRAVVQRVAFADVNVEGNTVGKIGEGLLVLVGAMQGDTVKDAEYIVKKCINLRIFKDEQDKMNLSVQDIGGEILVVSQFTLLGDARKGNRPSFILAGSPEESRGIFDKTVELFKQTGININTGEYGAHMKVSLLNDGPVTILLDSRKVF